MRSAQNVHPEFGLWSNLHRKAELGVTFIICGSIAAASEEPQGRLQADLVNPKAPRVLRSPGVGIPVTIALSRLVISATRLNGAGDKPQPVASTGVTGRLLPAD